jgi:hypothetical protein
MSMSWRKFHSPKPAPTISASTSRSSAYGPSLRRRCEYAVRPASNLLSENAPLVSLLPVIFTQFLTFWKVGYVTRGIFSNESTYLLLLPYVTYDYNSSLYIRALKKDCIKSGQWHPILLSHSRRLLPLNYGACFSKTKRHRGCDGGYADERRCGGWTAATSKRSVYSFHVVGSARLDRK